jgi:small redox-active disulfide protein 2
MEIKVLGSGCPNCRRLEKLAREAVAELGVEATVIKVTDFDQIMAYDILATPALVIDEQVMVSGRVPRKDQVAAWIGAAQEATHVAG